MDGYDISWGYQYQGKRKCHLTHSLDVGTVVEHAATPLTPELHEVRGKARLGLIEELRSSV